MMNYRASIAAAMIVATIFLPSPALRLAGEEPPAPESSRSVAEWIARLGSDSFEDREEAFAALFQLGEAAREAIEAASRTHVDFEVRLRSQELLGRMSRADLESKLQAFVADDSADSEASDEPLPGWRPFRELVGGERDARALFAEMTRAETAFLASIAGGPDSAERSLAERLEAFAAQDAEKQFATEAPPTSIAAMILAGAVRRKAPAGDDARTLDRELAAYLSMPGVGRALATAGDAKLLRQLLEAWIERRRDADLAPDFLSLAFQHDLAEVALRIARDALESDETLSYHLPDAILAAGRFGDASDIPRVERLLDNDRLCHTLHRNNQVIRIEVRDVALAVLWRLCDVDPKEKGFEYLQPVERTLYAVYSLGFDTNEKREAAHRQWREREAAGEATKEAGDSPP